ncbi:MAG: hypothetical protein ACM3QZ_01970 [Solirubrobacterales bacterium]
MKKRLAVLAVTVLFLLSFATAAWARVHFNGSRTSSSWHGFRTNCTIRVHSYRDWWSGGQPSLTVETDNRSIGVYYTLYENGSYVSSGFVPSGYNFAIPDPGADNYYRIELSAGINQRFANDNPSIDDLKASNWRISSTNKCEIISEHDANQGW